MNAGLAKPILYYLVYSEAVIDATHPHAAARAKKTAVAGLRND